MTVPSAVPGPLVVRILLYTQTEYPFAKIIITISVSDFLFSIVYVSWTRTKSKLTHVSHIPLHRDLANFV